MIFETGLSCEVDGDATGYWLLIKGNKILMLKDKVQFTLPEIDLYKLSKKLVRSRYLDRVEGRSCYVAELTTDTVAPVGMSFYDLRRLLGQIPDDLFFLAGKAYQILHWDRTHRYCSQCGAQTENKIDERAKLCPSCGFVNYPRISPAIIVAITKGCEILLAKGSRFPADFYSVLAGFVEPGETFEECVQREVGEEVGLKVKKLNILAASPGLSQIV